MGKGGALAGEVLRKKLLAGQKPGADGGPGADRAWRLAFARAARDMMKVPIDFTAQSVARMSLTELLELPPERALILMLEGPEEGLGLLILSAEVYSALIEVLTMGKCGAQTPDPRKPTRTDAAMLSPLADLAMANLEEALIEDGDLPWTSGFRYASFIEEARPLGLLLEEMPYRVLKAQVSLSQGVRTGEMLLVLPAGEGGQAARQAQCGASLGGAARLCSRHGCAGGRGGLHPYGSGGALVDASGGHDAPVGRYGAAIADSGAGSDQFRGARRPPRGDGQAGPEPWHARGASDDRLCGRANGHGQQCGSPQAVCRRSLGHTGSGVCTR